MLKKVAFTMYPVTDVPRARDFYTIYPSSTVRSAAWRSASSEGNSILLHQLKPKAAR